jgi:2-dehydro-3-deoxyphosphooctonate aldolase (KDO 8-P synthase)
MNLIPTTKEVKVANVTIGGKNPLVIVAGPCVIESEEAALKAAVQLKEIANKLDIPLIFKSSYDKANRTSIHSYRGPGLLKGLAILEKVKKETGLPILSDVHLPEDAQSCAEVLDIIQIPAFLCRQTDIITAVAKTGKPINVKKGQFLSPYDVGQIIQKIRQSGNDNIIITERGVSFGYNNLVVDMRAIPIMQSFGYPVMFDATHSVQLPSGKGDCSGGESQYVPTLAKSAAAAGCNAVFMEVHEDPSKALCDGPNMVALDELSNLIKILKQINAIYL